MRILAIDPGTYHSAHIMWNSDNETIIDMGIIDSDELLHGARRIMSCERKIRPDHVVVEGIASYGMPVGAEVFETCYLIGRIVEITGASIVYRKDIKLHLCGTSRAKDANIRQALIDRYGKPGTKKAPGKLYGVKKDLWSALAIATYYADTVAGEKDDEAAHKNMR